MTTRRVFLAGAVLLPASALAAPAAKKEPEDEVTPIEDLMREHGVLNRVLLVYEECARRLVDKRDLPKDVLPQAARMIRRFVEGYHEKNEEEFIFPRLEKAGKLTDLVKTLRRQHQAGRVVTQEIEKLASTSGDRARLVDRLGAFVRMYRPHEAREDTVLFPAFRPLVPDKEYAELGERMEASERALVGEGGFEKAVDEVAQLERALGIYELDSFTPKGG
jgi:hemerythrin-like domain-containing protein